MFIFVLLFFILITQVEAKEQASKRNFKSIMELSAKIDFRCIELKPIGICPKLNREPPIGVKVRFWQPKLLIETVKNPGEYTILEYGNILGAAVRRVAQMELEIATAIRPLTVTSGSSLSSLSTSTLQFNEVHLYDYPLDLGFDELCSDIRNQTLGIRYYTEADSLAWRQGDIENKLPQSIAAPLIGAQCRALALGASEQCMKTWGPLYPRTGFVVTPSEPVSSVVNALRAVSIAGDPLGAHFVVAPLEFKLNIPIDRVQMVYPVKTTCFPIGHPSSQWEEGKQSKDGHYVWIFWHRRDCCI